METKGKSRKNFKAETIKRLSPRLNCYCFSHSRAPRIQKFFLSADHGGREYFSLFLGPSTLKSILPALFFKFSQCTVFAFIVLAWEVFVFSSFSYASSFSSETACSQSVYCRRNLVALGKRSRHLSSILEWKGPISYFLNI